MGYFLIKNNVLASDGNVIIKCSTSACSIYEPNATSSCVAEDIGKIVTSSKELCIDTSKKTSAIGNTGSYLIAYGSGSAFSSVVKSGKLAVVKMTTTSIVLDKSMEYICVDSTTKAVTERDSGSSSCATGTTGYSCNTSTGFCISGGSAPIPSKYYMIEYIYLSLYDNKNPIIRKISY